VPVEQNPVAQSVATEQFEPRPHAGQGPPQSTSVSAPFATPSVQLGATQTRLQTPLAQSPANRHALSTSHFGQEPPQSVSVSSPFFKPSVHEDF
jgi:hypothetical protein